MRKWVVVLLAAVCAAVVFAGSAVAKGGNSANAKLCQKGGWQLLVRTDGSSFAGEQGCVSYAAQGGTLVSAAQFACESYGGTFILDDPTIPDSVWTCDFWEWNADGTLGAQRAAELERLCNAIPGDQISFTDFLSTTEAETSCRQP